MSAIRFDEKWNTLRCLYTNDRSIIVVLMIATIAFAGISASLFAFPVWNINVILGAFSFSLVVFFGILIACMPSEGMSNSLVTPTGLHFVIICIALLSFVLVVSKKLHGW